MQTIDFTFRAFEELAPGPKWQGHFDALWPWYERWFLQQGDAARPSYATCARALSRHMPEIVPTWERLVDLAGGGDLAARMLSMVNPPPYLSGCSQGAFTAGSPVLARTYDYSPERLEGAIVSSAWGGRRVIGMSDCLWGLLDGVNDAGLAVSLTFGGRRVIGDGFGVPLVVRYLLETCDSVAEACATLARLPFHLAHNLTLLDARGTVATVYIAPDRPPAVVERPAATNHQGAVDWPEHAHRTHTIEREEWILGLLADPAMTARRFVESFLAPPLHTTGYSTGFGTLYAAAYFVGEGRVEYHWPGTCWGQSFASFVEGTHTEPLAEPSVAS